MLTLGLIISACFMIVAVLMSIVMAVEGDTKLERFSGLIFVFVSLTSVISQITAIIRIN